MQAQAYYDYEAYADTDEDPQGSSGGGSEVSEAVAEGSARAEGDATSAPAAAACAPCFSGTASPGAAAHAGKNSSAQENGQSQVLAQASGVGDTRGGAGGAELEQQQQHRQGVPGAPTAPGASSRHHTGAGGLDGTASESHELLPGEGVSQSKANHNGDSGALPPVLSVPPPVMLQQCATPCYADEES
jgi:hypothetical protein